MRLFCYSHNMKKLSVEYAHIYTNQQIPKEQDLSLKILESVLGEEVVTKEDLVLTIMIDDYSFPDPSFNYDLFIGYLSEHGFSPDVVIRESALISDCDRTIRLINNEALKSEIVSYIQSKKKYPCSLFIATWYLIRLGCLLSNLVESQFTAEKLMNILPESFKPFEEKAFEIIRTTEFADKLAAIENSYFEGRGI